MSWLTTLLVGILGSVVGGGGMFGIALLCVKWYRISSFEGGSGYFVIGLALLGAMGGLIVSMLAARSPIMRSAPIGPVNSWHR